MSVAGAIRKKLTSGYAHLGNARKRPRLKGASNRSVSESIAAARRTAARQAAASKKK
jgi:hypothetical protein